MIPVTVKELSAALRQYDIKKRELDPARYEALADFRDFMPDLYPEMGPPPMNEDGTMKDAGPGGGPGGPPGMNEDLTRIMRALLSGDAVPNESMVKELGFTYDDLDKWIRARNIDTVGEDTVAKIRAKWEGVKFKLKAPDAFPGPEIDNEK